MQNRGNERIASPDVRAKADELTKGLDTDADKVEARHDFAAKRIRYLSLVSFGIGEYEAAPLRQLQARQPCTP
jgi:hypothetical protein